MKMMRRMKRLFGVPYSFEDKNRMFLDRLSRDNRIEKVTRQAGESAIILSDSSKVFARMWPHSDCLVFDQVFFENEYQPAVDLLKDNFKDEDPCYILDAGANVGYASRFFLRNLPEARIACIEPDGDNVKMLSRNLENFIAIGKVRVFQNALTDQAGENLSKKNDFRDGLDWSISVSKTSEFTGLQSVSVESLMNNLDWPYLSLLKMDIEGGERFIFGERNNTAFLKKVKVIAIEIHDEYNIRSEIYEALRSNQFIIFNVSQTTFAVNRNYLE